MKKRYSVNSENRLLITRQGDKKPLPVDGHFSIDKQNRLIYRLNEPPAWRREYGLPGQICLRGNWRLNPNYDLELVLQEDKDQCVSDRLTLKGEIISVEKDNLVFEIKGCDKKGLSYLRLLKLSGRWQADEANQINFLVTKEASPDTFVFKGAWQVNRNQQLTYTYEKTLLKKKTKIIHTLIFAGSWQISSAHKLTFLLTGSTASRFDFRAQLESPSLYPRARAIKYRIGIGLSGSMPQESRIISLYGTWKFSRKAGLNFQVDYGRGRIESIFFGANVYLTDRDEAVFSLVNKRGEDLGITVTFTHRFLKQIDSQLFLRLKKLKEESAIEAGMRIPF